VASRRSARSSMSAWSARIVARARWAPSSACRSRSRASARRPWRRKVGAEVLAGAGQLDADAGALEALDRLVQQLLSVVLASRRADRVERDPERPVAGERARERELLAGELLGLGAPPELEMGPRRLAPPGQQRRAGDPAARQDVAGVEQVRERLLPAPLRRAQQAAAGAQDRGEDGLTLGLGGERLEEALGLVEAAEVDQRPPSTPPAISR